MNDSLQQARCRECGVPLDGVTAHEDGCGELLRMARAMQAMTPEEIAAIDAAKEGQ